MYTSIFQTCRRSKKLPGGMSSLVIVSVGIGLSGCAEVPLERSNTLSSYEKLEPSNGFFTQSRVRVDFESVKSAKTAKLVPIVFSQSAKLVALPPEQQELIANATNRALCNSLSRRFQMVAFDQPADITVTGKITNVLVTGKTAAAASQVAAIAGSILIPVPVPTPRLPIGLGGLGAEAEAHNAQGKQVAAMIWARGANAITDKARVSSAGDAYDLAPSFANDFVELLTYGKDKTFRDKINANLPGVDDLVYKVNGTATSPICTVYGNGSGLIGLVGGNFGVPPEWTDNGKREVLPEK